MFVFIFYFFLFISCDKGSKSDLSSDSLDLFSTSTVTREENSDLLTSNNKDQLANDSTIPSMRSIDIFDTSAIPIVRSTGVSPDSDNVFDRFLYRLEMNLNQANSTLKKIIKQAKSIFIEQPNYDSIIFELIHNMNSLIIFFSDESKRDSFLNSIGSIRKPFVFEYTNVSDKKNAYELFLNAIIIQEGIEIEYKDQAKIMQSIINTIFMNDSDDFLYFISENLNKDEIKTFITNFNKTEEIFKLVFKRN